jgi:serine protease Do
MKHSLLRKGSSPARVVTTLGILVGLLAVGLFGWQTGSQNTASLSVGPQVAHAQERAATKDAVVGHAKALSTAFREAAEDTMPAVVTIRSKTKAKVVKREMRTPKENPFKGTPFEDFFNEHGDQFNMPGMPGMPDGHAREGTGSGVIIDKSGIVLTNNHVVAGADEVIIHLADGREFKGEDIKTDDQTDLAVVHIKADGDLPVAKLGDSDKLDIGDWVIAIGNPFELEQTVSAGIISGKGREIGSIRRAKFLQTDAAINPGNSGGPLVNLEGEVIGINTAIASNTGSFNGIGFAVPSNLASWVVPQLIKTGKVQRAYLGVAIGEIGNDLAKKFNVERNSGVLVSEVFPNTPASEAGLKEGDVIQRFSKQPVHNPRELQELVERTTLGSKNKVDVLRDGKTVSIEIVSKALPQDFGTVAHERPSKDNGDEAQTIESAELGINVTDLTPPQAEQLGFAGMSGALVADVEENGAAHGAGIRPGMLIMKVGKTTVKSATEFQTAVGKESLKDGILLLVRTKAGNRFVVLQQS